jgi:hypothetical protein
MTELEDLMRNAALLGTRLVVGSYPPRRPNPRASPAPGNDADIGGNPVHMADCEA